MNKELVKSNAIKVLVSLERRNILTSKDKVISLRRKYKLSQDDLAGDEVNRTLISYIENGKINLSMKTAEKIVRSANRIFDARGINDQIEVKDIFVDYDEEVRLVIQEYINILSRRIKGNEVLHKEYIFEIDEFLYKKAISVEKARVYELLGDGFQNTKGHNNCLAITYYLKALEVYTSGKYEEHLGRLIIKIARERVNAKAYDEAIKYIMLLVNSIDEDQGLENLEGEAIYMLYHYLGKACIGLEQYETAIEVYKKALKVIKQRKEVEKAVLILEMGQAYVMSNDFAKGNNCFKNALKGFENERNYNEYCLALNVIMDAVLKSFELEEESKLFKLDQLAHEMEFSLRYVGEEYEERYMNYIMLSKTLLYLKREEQAAEYFRKAYKLVMESNQLEMFSELLNRSYEVIRDLDLAKDIVNEGFIEQISLIEEVDEELKNGILALVGLLSEKGHNEKAYELVNGWMQSSGYQY